MKPTPLTKLVKAISASDPADLLATVSGLQLMPENADRAVRLEALTHAVASISSKGFGAKASINLKQLEKICNCELSGIEQFVRMEDPFNKQFTGGFDLVEVRRYRQMGGRTFDCDRLRISYTTPLVVTYSCGFISRAFQNPVAVAPTLLPGFLTCTVELKNLSDATGVISSVIF